MNGLPHARGGVSPHASDLRTAWWSSPRTWGCFYGFPVYRQIAQVFPTHVGVFPASRPVSGEPSSLPHARGGVSIFGRGGDLDPRSSPRTWGCFSGGIVIQNY